MIDKVFIFQIKKKQTKIRLWSKTSPPRLKMAIPRPTSDKIFTEPSRI